MATAEQVLRAVGGEQQVQRRAVVAGGGAAGRVDQRHRVPDGRGGVELLRRGQFRERRLVAEVADEAQGAEPQEIFGRAERHGAAVGHEARGRHGVLAIAGQHRHLACALGGPARHMVVDHDRRPSGQHGLGPRAEVADHDARDLARRELRPDLIRPRAFAAPDDAHHAVPPRAGERMPEQGAGRQAVGIVVAEHDDRPGRIEARQRRLEDLARVRRHAPLRGSATAMARRRSPGESPRAPLGRRRPGRSAFGALAFSPAPSLMRGSQGDETRCGGPV